MVGACYVGLVTITLLKLLNQVRVTSVARIGVGVFEVLLLANLTSFSLSGQGIVSTIAGTTLAFPSPIGAVNAPLGLLGGIAVDAQGSVYAADNVNNVVVRIAPSGQLSVVAGNGLVGFGGDGGSATSAWLSSPAGVAVDIAGNLYIADSGNQRIRRVSTDGTITTVAGNGAGAFSGDGGAALKASFSGPLGIAVDARGNIFVADSQNCRVRKISGGIVSTVAGNGAYGFSGDGSSAMSAMLSYPTSVAMDSAGNLYIADAFNHRVRAVAPNGIITTIAGNGSAFFFGDGQAAANASLSFPQGVAADSNGNLYIVDSGNYRIRQVGRDGKISTVAGNGKAGYSGDGGLAVSASLGGLGNGYADSYGPLGVAVGAAGSIYIADTYNYRIRQVANGTINTIAGNGAARVSGDGGAASSASLGAALGVSADSKGNIYLADLFRVREISGGTIRTVAGTGLIGDSVDGIPATTAALSHIGGIAVDSVGDLYLSDTDNQRIRKVSGGVIATVAGNGMLGFSGDGGPATAASLLFPAGMAIDAAGNLYIADKQNNRIRKISGGIITTVAGNGMDGFSGDGGPAVSASLASASGVAVDSSGNIYIADVGNGRVRMVSGGIITTVAGNGSFGYSGDGGPAASAQLGFPYAIAVDASGAIYIGDEAYDVVRKVSGGIITTVAGNDAYGFSGDGGPATSASLRVPDAVAVDSSGNLYIADQGNYRIRKVSGNAASFLATPAALSFSATTGGSIQGPQNISLAASFAGVSTSGLAFTATPSVPWILVSSPAGTLPATLSVTVNPGSLSVGTYTGTITIVAQNAVPSEQSVSVTLVVDAPAPGVLALSNKSISISTNPGLATTSSLALLNPGGTPIRFAVMSTGTWLSVSPNSGSVSAAAQLALTVAVNPADLTAGTYTGTIQVSSQDTNQMFVVPVTLVVSASTSQILLSQTGLTFTTVAGGGPPLSQSFGILNSGQGILNWTAQAIPLGGGNSWLSIDQSSGTVVNPLADVSIVNVAVDPTKLSAGTYYGVVQVNAGETQQQSVTIVLNVLAPGSNPGPEVRPSGLIFAGTAGGVVQPQTVQVGESQQDTFISGSIPTDAAFNYTPSNATVTPGIPAVVTISSSFSNVSPGTIQHGTITLQFSNGIARTISILTVIAPSGGAGTPAKPAGDHAEQSPGCSAPGVFVQPTLLTDLSSSVVTVGQPATVQARVVDSCGNPVSNGSVSSTFSSGDPQVSLTHIGNGVWTGTWVPANGVNSSTTIAFNAVPASGNSLPSSAQVTVGVRPPSGANPVGPLISAVVNSASYSANTVVAPGEVVSIFGSSLSDPGANEPPQGGIFPTELNGAQALVGGLAMPLRFAAPSQLTGQVPFEVSSNSTLQLSVTLDGNMLSVPMNVVVVAADPAVYTQDGSGTGPGRIADATGNLLTESNPPSEGDTVVIYANGLGALKPPDGILYRTANDVVVTIGGMNAATPFAGLAPGYTDLYQVNAVVPCFSDSDVSVTLTVAGRTSPPVKLSRPRKPGPIPSPPGIACPSN